MIPSFYEFYNPVKIISGDRALENIPYELTHCRSYKPLLITDPGVQNAGLVRQVLEAFRGFNSEITALYDQVPADSSHHVVQQIAQEFFKHGCDSILALGGGSVIDTAKGVNIVVTENCTDLLQLTGSERLTNPMYPLYVIPTTAGTGSEVTAVAMIYNEDKQTKMAFTSYYLLPTLAVLDPRMTMGMPPQLTAATGMDALTHAIEAYTCLQKNPLSDAYAISAINLIRDNLLQAVQNSRDKNVRLAMANAACMAGIAFSNSMVGMVHSLGHAVGGVCHIPHGTALAILLPHALEYNLPRINAYCAQLLLPLGGEHLYLHTPAEQRAQRFITIIREMQQELYRLCELPMNLQQAGVPRHKLGEIARATLDDPALTFNPRKLEYEDALEILRKAYQA